MKYSDAELINGLVTRDEKVLSDYYVLYYQIVRRFVLANKGNEEDARDLFQETLLILYQKVRSEHLALTCSLGTYIYSISRYLWLKELGRKKRVVPNSVELEEFMDVDSDIGQINEYNERLNMYRSHFDKLSSDCKKVLCLFLEGHSITEITHLMGYSSEQHTRNRRYRCKSSLIKSIRARYGHEIEDYGVHKAY